MPIAELRHLLGIFKLEQSFLVNVESDVSFCSKLVFKSKTTVTYTKFKKIIWDETSIASSYWKTIHWYCPQSRSGFGLINNFRFFGV